MSIGKIIIVGHPSIALVRHVLHEHPEAVIVDIESQPETMETVVSSETITTSVMPPYKLAAGGQFPVVNGDHNTLRIPESKSKYHK